MRALIGNLTEQNESHRAQCFVVSAGIQTETESERESESESDSDVGSESEFEHRNCYSRKATQKFQGKSVRVDSESSTRNVSAGPHARVFPSEERVVETDESTPAAEEKVWVMLYRTREHSKNRRQLFRRRDLDVAQFEYTGRLAVEESTQACEAEIEVELLAPDHGQFVVAKTHSAEIETVSPAQADKLPLDPFWALKEGQRQAKEFREWSCDKDGILGGVFWQWRRIWPKRRKCLLPRRRFDLERKIPQAIRMSLVIRGFRLKSNSKATQTDYDRVRSIAKIARDRLSARAVPQQVPEEGCAEFFAWAESAPVLQNRLGSEVTPRNRIGSEQTREMQSHRYAINLATQFANPETAHVVQVQEGTARDAGLQ